MLTYYSNFASEEIDLNVCTLCLLTCLSRQIQVLSAATSWIPTNQTEMEMQLHDSIGAYSGDHHFQKGKGSFTTAGTVEL